MDPNVKMVTPKGKQPTRTYYQYIERFARFGKELRISPKANATISRSGFKSEFFVPTVNVVVGIGKDHTADLTMTLEAWKAFTEGAEVHITTTEEFKKLYL